MNETIIIPGFGSTAGENPASFPEVVVFYGAKEDLHGNDLMKKRAEKTAQIFNTSPIGVYNARHVIDWSKEYVRQIVKAASR